MSQSRACGRWYSGTPFYVAVPPPKRPGTHPRQIAKSPDELGGGGGPEHRLRAVIGTGVSTGVAREPPSRTRTWQGKFFRSAAPKILVNNAPAI